MRNFLHSKQKKSQINFFCFQNKRKARVKKICIQNQKNSDEKNFVENFVGKKRKSLTWSASRHTASPPRVVGSFGAWAAQPPRRLEG